ncbi:MAG: hypothetical protein AB7Q37_01125 [Pyrinomonadaceae bacterium]
MRYKILAVLFSLIISIVLFLSYQLQYPSPWDQIHAGLTRQQVYALAGLPTDDSGEIKGAFWFQSKLLITHELHVYFEQDVAKTVDVTRYVGSEQEFAYKQTVRSED